MAKKARPGDLANLTHAFSAAAVDPALWEDAMGIAAQVTGSTGAALLPALIHPTFALYPIRGMTLALPYYR